MIAPWSWAIASLAAIVACEAGLGWSGASASSLWAESIRFATAVTLFCPVVARLGARRPHDRAWQWIVVALWVILALPAAAAILYGRRGLLAGGGAPWWFLVAFVALSLIDTLPTRFWPSAILAAAGQVCLISAHLPIGNVQSAALPPLGGLGLLVAALTLAAAGIPRRRAAKSPEDHLWLDFRDTFGTLWALRAAQRINACAAMYGWSVRLGWHGFYAASDLGSETTMIPQDRPALHRSLKGLLRRFVSPEWLAERLQQGPRATQTSEKP